MTEKLCNILSVLEAEYIIAEYDYIKKTAVLETKVGAIAIIPWDIAINSNGHPIYTERTTQTINLLKYGKTQVQLTLKDWRPLNVCSTLYGDLLLIMDSCDQKQTKVVRYSGTEEKQSIQFDDKGQPLFH